MATLIFKVLLSLSAVLVLLAANNVRAYSIQQERQRISSVINSPRFFPQRHRRAPEEEPLQRLDGRHMFTGSYSGNYAIGRGPSFVPDFAPKVKYTTNGRKFSVFAPPHGDFFPFGERFYWPVDE